MAACRKLDAVAMCCCALAQLAVESFSTTRDWSGPEYLVAILDSYGFTHASCGSAQMAR